jgi:metallo-beta-lactamase class B
MFANALLTALALAGQQIVIPIGNPPQVERAKAPLETAGPAWVASCQGSDDWDRPAPPVRIHGNTYMVGTCGISAILIAGSDGHVLIDGGTERGAELIAANIRALGFKLTDVRILLHSHEHHDHVGGIARLQQLTGASLYASPVAAKVFATGTAGAEDPQVGINPPFPAARVDHRVNDGDHIRLGNIMLTAMATPGHTPGALSWRWVSCDGAVCPTIVYADSLSPVSSDRYKFSAHPAYLAAYRASIARIAASPCDLLLTPHPSASNMPDRFAGKAPMRDSDGCKAYAASLSKRLDERLAKEKAE